MNRSVVSTGDHSPTLFVPELDEHYHSSHGAVRESQHVFIKAGLHQFPQHSGLRILEIGMGTGLNVLLTFLEKPAENNICYTALEKYPLEPEEWSQLDYPKSLSRAEAQPCFEEIHRTEWEKLVHLRENFALHKTRQDLKSFAPAKNAFDLIYFDAFAPSAQPGLWTPAIFGKMYKGLRSGGLLVTYCVKGEVRRNMQAADFEVTKIPGPPGKREMTRAFKR